MKLFLNTLLFCTRKDYLNWKVTIRLFVGGDLLSFGGVRVDTCIVAGHPYPPFYPTNYSNPRFIQNVLLSSAKDFFKSNPSHPTKDSNSHESSSTRTDQEELDEDLDDTEDNKDSSSATPK